MGDDVGLAILQAAIDGIHGGERPGQKAMVSAIADSLKSKVHLLVQAGTAVPSPPAGVLASTAWRREGVSSFALEGFVPVAGAAIDWLVEIGVLDANSAEIYRYMNFDQIEDYRQVADGVAA